jgi:cytochrome c-type biogenesis protein
MLNDFFSLLSTSLSENIWLALIASFLWGVISIVLSPCHLSSIPLVIGFLTTQGKITAIRTFSLSLNFALGILLSISAIGFGTAMLGRLMGDLGRFGNYSVAFIFVFIGLVLLDVIKLNWNSISLKPSKRKGLLSALILGLIFGIGLGPCTFAFLAPVLGVVFQMAQTNFINASLLLLMFAVGHCSVIVGAGLLGFKLQHYLNWTEESKAILWLKRICGVLVLLGGVYIFFNNY